MTNCQKFYLATFLVGNSEFSDNFLTKQLV